MRFASEKRVLGEITGELRQNCKRLARLLLAHMHDSEQNSGERTEISSGAGNAFEFLGRNALLTFDTIEANEPAHEERHASEQVFARASGQFSVRHSRDGFSTVARTTFVTGESR